jgi:DNA-directed RNA polymerase specialized sigma24 family protein
MRGRADDHEDFLRATLRHADLLHTLALRLAPHPADADIVQETYLRAYAAWRRRRPDDVGAWLATICLNTGRDERRRPLRRPGT